MESFSFRWTVEMLLLPPGGPLLLSLIALAVFWRRRSTRALGLVTAGLAMAWLFSLPVVAGQLAGLVEGSALRMLTAEQLRLTTRTADAPGAVVVLGGGMRKTLHADPKTYQPNRRTLERLSYGASVARATALPMLVSGGPGSPVADSEALVMARTLESAFGIKPKWIEDQSPNTAANATESALILGQAGVKRVILVTHAYHMPRAAAAFRAAGLSVLPAPHDFVSGGDLGVGDFIPSPAAIESSWLMLHELIGLVWYRWLDRI